MGKLYRDGIKYRILSLTIQCRAKPMNSIKDDKYLDFCLFALSALLYAFWHAFFPLLLLSFVFLWYRRELAWRIKREKPKFFWGLFSLEEEAHPFVNVRFWLFGVVWNLLIMILMMVSIHKANDIVIYETLSKIFDETVAYIYPGHADSEFAIAKRALQDAWAAQNIHTVVTDEIVRDELKKTIGVRIILMNYHYDFICLTVYVIIFARPLIMQPFYQAAMKDPNRQFHWKKLNLWRIFISVLFIGVLYYMFFLMPIHRDNCAEIHNRAALLCSNLATSKNYIAFPARISAYWAAILFMVQMFIGGYLVGQEKEHDNASEE